MALVWMCALLCSAAFAGISVSAQATDGPEAGVEIPTLYVRDFRFQGNTLVPDEELAALLEPMAGRELTVLDLHTATLAIKLHYQAKGYLLVEAIVPPQEVTDGVVEIAIVEGRYGQVLLHNRSRLRDSVATAFFRSIVPGDVITAEPFERVTLLLSDVPGVEAEVDFAPGTEIGTADLHVTLRDGARSSGEAAFGFSGENPAQDASALWSVNVHNASGRADEVSVSLGVGGTARNLAIAYTIPTGTGMSYGVEYRDSRRKVDGVFTPLDIETWAQNVTLSARYVLRRTSTADRKLDLSYEHVSSGREILGLVSRDVRHRLSAGVSGTASARQDRRVQYAVQGTYGVSLPAGGDDSTYAKLTGTYSYLYEPVPGTQLNVSANAQVALTGLDASERMDLGGAGGVRGHAPGVLGDTGVVGRLQVSRIAGRVPLPGIVQVTGFLDGGSVWLRSPGPAEAESQQRYGFGLGLSWTLPRGGALSVDRAWPLGESKPNGSGGGWSIRFMIRF